MGLGLSPELTFDEEGAGTESVETSSTFAIDFERGRILNQRIDGIKAIEQFVHMALRTDRYTYPIYSHDVGNELKELLSDSEATDAYKEMEIPRLITEAIEYDDRIISVNDMEIRKEGDTFRVFFVVEADEGFLEVEEILNV